MRNIRNNPWFRFAVRAIGTVATLGVFFALAPKIFAQSGQPPKLEDVAATAGEVKTAVNILWMLFCAFLVFFMQAGFALVEVGFTRAKNAAHTMTMNMMVFAIGAFGYWLCGFAFQFGGVNYSWPEVTTAGATAGAWAHSPVTLGDWTGLLATPLISFGQAGLLGGSG